MNKHSNIAVMHDGRRLVAQFEHRKIQLHLSDEEFWLQYGQLWAKVDHLPFNLTPLLWQGQLLSFGKQEIREIRQFKVLNRLKMREQYPNLPDTFGESCLKSGVLRSYILQKASQKYGHNSEAAIRLAAHFLQADIQSIRSLIAVRRALRDH